MDTLEKTVSNLIENQFPAVFRELGPTFVLFVKKYYEWMEEQGNVLYQTRRIYETRDIDETTEQFLTHFKETYLKNIQLNTIQNTRTLVKHSLDLYRSKGTEQSIQLLFRVAFGTGAEIYYPRDDLFKTSDGWWIEPEFIEVTISNDNNLYVGSQIQGSNSKAIAYVEKVVRRYAQNYKLSDVLYISAREGNFQAGDLLTRINETVQPKSIMIGSLTSLAVSTNGSGANFIKGDIVEIQSDSGIGGKARVSKVTQTSGQITATLQDGGYGYNSNSDVLISEKIITTEGQLELTLFETITQPIANINFLQATGTFQPEDIINLYHANNSLKGSARIISIELATLTSGKLKVEVLLGNCSGNAFYTSGNVVSANQSIISGFIDKTASGEVMGWNINTTANTTKIGVRSISNAFEPSIFVYSSQSIESANVLTVSQGSGLSFEVSNSLLYEEYVTINKDFLKDYANTFLNANNYGFKASSPVTNANTVLYGINWANTLFGKIQTLDSYNPGSGYNEFPIVRVFDADVAPLTRGEIEISLIDSPHSFLIGELITQDASDARGIIIEKNVLAKTIRVQNLRILDINSFVATTNSTTTVVGYKSNYTANIESVSIIPNSPIQGYNANVVISLDTANSASELQIINSGFGYRNGELIEFQRDANAYGFAIANVYSQGKTSGYYKENGGFLSDSNKLYDGHYYQQFSYDVLSSLSLNKYEKLLKDIVHTAGFALFGTIKIKNAKNAYSKKSVSSITLT